jgi:hypothetical protein
VPAALKVGVRLLATRTIDFGLEEESYAFAVGSRRNRRLLAHGHHLSLLARPCNSNLGTVPAAKILVLHQSVNCTLLCEDQTPGTQFFEPEAGTNCPKSQ